MSRYPGFYQWTEALTSHFPELSKPQVYGLALWSWGMLLARCCSLTTVAFYLHLYLGRPLPNLQQQLREWYKEARAKRGKKRRQLEVTTGFAPLLQWVLEDWPTTQLAVAVDASTLGTRFVVLSISVVYRGCACPVAWKILPATAKEAWKDHWLALLKHFRGVVPAGWTVLVLADRGLWARWLFEAIVGLGWHPLLRINAGGTFRPEGWTHFVPLKQFTPQEGMRWRGRGTAFSTKACQLRCTLLAWWGPGHQEPWLVLTDLAPEEGDACWYGLRAWIEQGFKDSKRGGWQWQHTRMHDPQRAERLWLALAVTTLWLLRVGGEAEESVPVATLPELKLWESPEAEARRTRRRRRWRLVSVFAHGYAVILMALLAHRRLPLGQWSPEPWPEVPGTPQPPDTAALPESESAAA